jgi:acyl-coenzyme A thioesterase PaaI-like protein
LPDRTRPDSSAPPFYTRYGFDREGETGLAIEPYPAICVAGTLRATVIASAIDLVGGFHTRAIAGSDATFTSDLSLRIPAPARPRRLTTRSEVLRAGKRLVSTSVTIDGDAAPYAVGVTTFARIPRPPGEAPDVESLATPMVIGRHPLDRPLDEEVGIERVDPSAGHVRLALRPALANPEGVMQGALVALVVECASLALANHERDAPQVVSELDLRYLAAASRGPVESRAAWIGDARSRMIRVELRDLGREQRITTAALVRVTNAPA